MALPTFRYPAATVKKQSQLQQTEPDENERRAALKRRIAVRKQPIDDQVVDQRKRAGY